MFKQKNMQALIEVLPFLSEMLQIDANIAVTDMDSFVAIQPSKKIISDFIVGDKQTMNPFLENIMRNKKTVSEITPRFNVPAQAIITPVYNDDGSNAGMIFVVKDMEQQVRVEQISNNTSDTFHQINEAVEMIASESMQLSDDVHSTARIVDNMVGSIQSINSIIESIQNIADQSNLLSLNAKIEAARAGEAGRGFGVVATEVSKLSAMSKESADRVRISLKEMKEEIEMISNKMRCIEELTKVQAASTEEMASGVTGIYEDLKELSKIAKLS